MKLITVMALDGRINYTLQGDADNPAELVANLATEPAGKFATPDEAAAAFARAMQGAIHAGKPQGNPADLALSPAPWTMGGHPGDASGYAWREVLSHNNGPFSPTFVCSAIEPNARLICAAPEMLVTLKALLLWACANTSPRDANSPHDLLVDAAAAILKATGERHAKPI